MDQTMIKHIQAFLEHIVELDTWAIEDIPSHEIAWVIDKAKALLDAMKDQ